MTTVIPTGHDRYEIHGNMKSYEVQVKETTRYDDGTIERIVRWEIINEVQI